MAKSSFKDEHSLEWRQAEASRWRKMRPDRILVILEKADSSDIPDIDRKIYPVRADSTMGQFVCFVRKMIKLSAEKAIFVFVKNAQPPTAALMSAIYEENKDEDGFLYMTYCDKAGGDYIPAVTQLTLGVGPSQPVALQPEMTQSQLSKSKRKNAAVEVSEPSPKRTREVEKVPNKGKAKAEVSGIIQLSMGLASTDSDSNDSFVAQDIAKSMLSPKDEEKVDSHCSVEISNERYKMLYIKYGFYRIQSYLLKKEVKQHKANEHKSELLVMELKSEVEKLKRELARSKEERGALSCSDTRGTG